MAPAPIFMVLIPLRGVFSFPKEQLDAALLKCIMHCSRITMIHIDTTADIGIHAELLMAES